LGIVGKMDKVYYDPKHSAEFGSVVKLVKASRNKKRDVEEWLAGQTHCINLCVRGKILISE
jgi:hypothetical protein